MKLASLRFAEKKSLEFASLEEGYEEIKYKFIGLKPIFKCNQIRYFHINPCNLNNKESYSLRETLTVVQKVLSSNKVNNCRDIDALKKLCEYRLAPVKVFS